MTSDRKKSSQGSISKAGELGRILNNKQDDSVYFKKNNFVQYSSKQSWIYNRLNGKIPYRCLCPISSHYPVSPLPHHVKLLQQNWKRYDLMTLSKGDKTKPRSFNAILIRNVLGNGNESGYCENGDGNGNTWMLISVLAMLTYGRLDIRHGNTPGFHANVWNEHDVVRP